MSANLSAYFGELMASFVFIKLCPVESSGNLRIQIATQGMVWQTHPVQGQGGNILGSADHTVHVEST